MLRNLKTFTSKREKGKKPMSLMRGEVKVEMGIGRVGMISMITLSDGKRFLKSPSLHPLKKICSFLSGRRRY